MAARAPPTPPQPANSQSEIIVTGSRVATPADDVAANVTVLSREDFEVEKPRQLADILRRVAGVHIDQVGGRGGTGSLYLRGADPNYTLVLVDGVRVNDPTNARGGSFDFSTFDVADIERVEIARGPYSAVYGGDALAGVVNIVTRHAPPEKTRAALDAMGGGYDVHETCASTPAARWAPTPGTSAPATRTRAKSRAATSSTGNAFRAASTSAWAPPRRRSSPGATRRPRAQAFPDDSGGYEFAEIRDTEQRDADEAVFGAGLNTGVGAANFALQVGYFDRDDHIDSPGVAPGIRDPFGVPPSVVDTSLRRYSATFTGTQKFSELLSVAYGVDWLREEGTSDGILDFGGGFVLPTSFELTRDSWAPFAEARVTSTFGLSMQAGVRVDQPDGESSVTSPRVRMEYEFADSGFTMAGAWGKAFKLPSMYALGHPLVGNPDLVPERGESWEIEFAQTLLDGKARWNATWFEGEFRNAIDFDPGPPPMLVNRNRVDTQGVEIAGRLALAEQWQIDASVTQRRRVASLPPAAQLRNRPEWRAGASAHWNPLASLQFSAAVTYVGSSLDSSIATGDVRLDAYTRVDVSAVWQVSPRLETYLAIDNLTDQQYEEFVGNVARGIMPRAGVRFSL